MRLAGEVRGKFDIFLLAIALAAAVPAVLLGASQFIEYDGYWHVFIAQQDDWSRFWEDIRANAHPPLYFLLLKLVLHLGRAPLIYRAISLTTGFLSVIVIGRIARKVTASNVWGYQAALAYGLAMPTIVMACEVRSYMLCTFLVLLSFSFLLDIEGEGDVIPRVGFASAAILACYSHYFAFFYCGLAVMFLGVRRVVSRYRGSGVSWKTETATVVPVLAAIYVLYTTHAEGNAHIQPHLLRFYYDASGHEGILRFLLTNWRNFLNLFSPYKVSSDAAAAGVLIVGLAGGAALTVRATRRARWTILITGAMLAGLAAASVAGKYPFGGELRQQFLLFPFLVLCAVIAAAQVIARIPDRAQWAPHVAIALAVMAISSVRYHEYPKFGGKLLQSQMNAFDGLAPDPEAVYLDQFNLITFFMHHDDWRWTLLKAEAPYRRLDVYRLRRGDQQMLVLRDQDEWNVKPDNVDVYKKLATAARNEGIQDLSVFNVRQTPFPDVKKAEGAVLAGAVSVGMCEQRLAVDARAWYATFRLKDCGPLGLVDDASSEIVYSGPWSHRAFAQAKDGTVSYSNEPGASARLTVHGTEVTYIYTKAFNRGVAEIRIDGAARDPIDLYSPNVVWQARRTFRHLTSGRHTVEVTVSGRMDGKATDRYIDIDAVVVQ